MKIAEIQVDGFGVWSGLEVDEISDKVTVFFGRNEAGKTTLMQFVRSVLYGFSPDRRVRYLPPVHGGSCGGRLRLVGPRGLIEVKRHSNPNDSSDSLGKVAVVAADGTMLGQHQLNTLLSGVDEAIFNNVFAVGLRELQELTTLDDTEAAEQLYKLSYGLDRVSLVDVTQELERSRERILARDDRPSQIVQLLSQHDDLQKQVEKAKIRSRRWAQIASQHDAMEQEIGRIEQNVTRLEAQSQVVEIALQTKDIWRERCELNDRIAALGVIPELSSHTLERLEQLGKKIGSRRNRLNEIKQQRTQVRSEAAQQPINRLLWAQAARIEAIGEHALWIESLENQTRLLQSEVTSLRAELAENCSQAGLSDDADIDSLPDITPKTLTLLRPPARSARQEKQRLVQARLNRQTGQREAQHCADKLEEGLAQLGKSDLSQAISASADQVMKLRRRLELEQRSDEMDRRRQELLDRGCELLGRQVLPLWLLGSLGGLFVFGVVLLLTGLIGGSFLSISSSLGWALSLLGAGGAAAAVTAKLAVERSALRQLEACNRQSELLDLQTKQLNQERQQLDELIPLGGGQLDSRLTVAQAELDSLQDLLPLDTKRQAALQRIQAADVQIAQANGAVNDARKRWQEALLSVGIPQTLSPKNVRELSHYCQQIRQLHQRLRAREEELQRRQAELSSLADRIDQLLVDTKIECSSEDTQEKLQTLSNVLARQQQLVERRNTLRQQYRQLRREENRYSRNIEKLLRHRRSLFTSAGVSDEIGLKHLLEKCGFAQTLISQRDELTRQIDAAIGGRCSLQEVADEIKAHGDGKLEPRWEQLISQCDEANKRQARLRQQQGQLQHEMKTLVDDRTISEAKLKIGCIEQQLKKAIRRWQVLTVTSILLESIRQTYETHRQPETLREASRYLNQLTDGAYTRIWTPLGQRVLCVDDAEGQPLSLEVLSRGTREAVFLSLRLALVTHYARHGAVLPVVLDDVLVNFDTERAKSAARVLRDFAKQGNQILLFTCHEHIMKIFKAARIEVRVLPNHTEVVPLTKEAKKSRRKKPTDHDKLQDDEQAEDLEEEEDDELQPEQLDEEIWEEDDDDEVDSELEDTSESEVDEEEEEYEDEESDDEELEQDDEEEELDQGDIAA